MTSHFFPDWVRKNLVFNRGVRYLNQNVPQSLMRSLGSGGGPTLTKVGSEYGGWFVPLEQIDARSIVYSLGIGVDTTFDEQLIERTQCVIVGCDPTPHAIEHVAARTAAGLLPSSHFLFHQVAVWNTVSTLKLYEPKTRGWIGSYSALNLQGTERFIEVPARPLSHIVRENGHARIDILKIDIEGAEHVVIPEILSSGIPIGWICLEIDQPIPRATSEGLVRSILAAGFLLRSVDGWNFTFEQSAS